MRAYEILQQYKHTQVDTEHVFLALLQQSGGAVPQIMKQLEASVEEMQQKLERVLESMPPCQYESLRRLYRPGVHYTSPQAGDGYRL